MARKDEFGQPVELEAEGQPITITNPGKVLFPKIGVTKLDLARYYLDVGPALMTWIRDRPVLLERYPNGVGENSFFQKRIPDSAPSWLTTTTVETIITSHAERSGIYTSEELPRGMRQVPYSFPGDRELAQVTSALAAPRDDTWITAIDDPYLPVHYGTINLLPFLQGDERWVTVSIVQTGEPHDYLLAGQLLAQAIAGLDRRVVLLASGGLSHRFWPLRQFRDHEAADPVAHLRTPEARQADERVLAWMRAGQHAAIIDYLPEYRAHAPEGRFGHYLLMAGALGGRDWTAPGTQFGEYESVAGTGQAHVWFDAAA